MNSYSKIVILMCLGFFLLGCGKKEQQVPVSPVNVIFETDMGNDVDDALALDLLYKYKDEGRVNILAIMLNKDYRYAPEYIDIMGTWYGYPEIPVGILKKGETLDTNDMNFTTKVCMMEENGQPKYERTLTDYESLPDASKLYRKLLSEQPDNSVTVISVGFSTNLVRLLDTPADEYSSLSGSELIAKKVKLLSVMAGCFDKDDYSEYNVLMDIPSAQKVFTEWPTEIVFTPSELGEKILYPGKSIQNDFKWSPKHPMVDGYSMYAEMPYDRPTWDVTAVLYVMEPDSAFFHESPKGFVSIDEKGVSHFKENEQGKHVYLTTTPEQQTRIKDYFVRNITAKPAKYK